MDMTTKEPTSATEGATFVFQGETMTVGPKCAANAGRWICIKHPALGAFRNQFAKDQHLDRPGKHVLAWVCLEHGPEVP